MAATTPTTCLADCVSMDDFRAAVRDLMPGGSEQAIESVAANMRAVVRASKSVGVVHGMFHVEHRNESKREEINE